MQVDYQRLSDALLQISQGFEVLSQVFCNKVAVETPSTNKKRPRDPDAPKQPLSAYQLFIADQRESLKQGEFGSRGIMKEAARRWNEASDKDKEPYIHSAATLKTQFMAEMEKYKSKKQAVDQAVVEHDEPLPPVMEATPEPTPVATSAPSPVPVAKDTQETPKKKRKRNKKKHSPTKTPTPQQS